MKLSIRSSLIVTALSVAMTAVLAQDYVSEDDVVDINELSRAGLRAEIENIENEFYRVFNAIVDYEQLEVHCSTYTPTNSHIKQRACEPKFLVEARDENLMNWQNTTDVLQTPRELRSEMAAEFEGLTVAMNVVLQESQYFRELNRIL